MFCLVFSVLFFFLFFFFNDTATTEIYTLSLHDALPICLFGGEGRVDRYVSRASAQAGIVGQRPFGPVLRNDRDFIARLDTQLAQAERDGLHPFERLAMRDGDPGAANFRPERRREAGMPIDRSEEQLSQRASAHGPNSTTNVGLPGIAVPFRCFMVAVTITESGREPGRNRSRTAANAVDVPAVVRTVSFGSNVTTGPVAGKVVAAYTTGRFWATPPSAKTSTWSGADKESSSSVESGVSLIVSRVTPVARTESGFARTFTVWGLENSVPARACNLAGLTVLLMETPVVLSRTTMTAVSSELQ